MTIDRIVSKDGEVFAIVDHHADASIPHHFSARILDNRFPAELVALVDEYNGLVDGMVLSLLDEVEEKIQAYDLRLAERNESVFCIRMEGPDSMSFFNRYPTGQGFVDEYPGTTE